MRNIYNAEDIFFEDYKKSIQDIGGYNTIHILGIQKVAR